ETAAPEEGVEARGQGPPVGLSLTFTVQETVEERQAHDGQSALTCAAEESSAIEFHHGRPLFQCYFFCGSGGWVCRRRGVIERLAQCHASEQRAQAKTGILERAVGVREIVDSRTSDTAAVRIESSRNAGRVSRIVVYILPQPLGAREAMAL